MDGVNSEHNRVMTFVNLLRSGRGLPGDGVRLGLRIAPICVLFAFASAALAQEAAGPAKTGDAKAKAIILIIILFNIFSPLF